MRYEVVLKKTVDQGIIDILKYMIMGSRTELPKALPPHPLFDDGVYWRGILVGTRAWMRKREDGRWHVRVEYEPHRTVPMEEFKDFLSREVEQEVEDDQQEIFFNLNYC